ncbi:MAG: 50S ribosomal protein L7/L12 [Spirochaetes bacterium]|nr:50S ribosomal protein L7/L12 [Spirochaetota bacterium]
MAKLTKEEFIAAVKEMTVVELNDLVEALQKEFNVTAAAPVAAAAAAGPAAAPAEEKTAFDVFLTGHDAAQKINVIKIVREVTGLGLKEAKEAVEKGGEKIKEGVKKEEAEEIKKKVEAAGGKVEIK